MDLKSMTLIEMQEYMESIGEKKFREIGRAHV